MKILFIFPNIGTLMPPVYSFGIGALSAILKKNNHQVFTFSVNKVKDISKIFKVLNSSDPDIVGFTGISSQYFYIYEMAMMVKRWNNIVPVICGGTHAWLRPEDYIKLDCIDGVLVGEGDDVFLEFVNAIQKGIDYTKIKNFWFKKENKIIKNEYKEFIQDLDSLPYVDREVFDYQKIINLNNYTVFMLAGRGCPYNCSFCSLPYLRKRGHGKFSRLRSPDHVLGEIKELSDKYKFKYIYFRDDTFTWNKEWTLEYCVKYSEKFDYPFEILTRADCLDKEIMDHLKLAGCSCVWIGVDSGNEYIRNEILRKNISNKDLLKPIKYLQSIGIKTLMTNMVGLPFETKESFQDTIRLNKIIYSSNTVISQGTGSGPKIFTFSPFPGTSLFNLCRENGWLEKMDYGFKVYQEAIVNMKEFPKEEVYKARRTFRFHVYRESQPLKACLFKLYDSKTGQYLMNLVPKTIFGKVTEVVSKLTSTKT